MSHSHSHSDSHSHSHQHQGGMSHCHHPAPGAKQLSWLVVLTLGYMVAEIVGGLASGSLALLADAGHMAIDAAAMTLSLFAIWIARKPPSAAKTYGYYRAEILAALINGALLVVVSLWIFWEAYHRISEPRNIRGELMALVSSGGLFVNLIGIALIHKHQAHNLNVRGMWLHLMTDLLGSVASLIAAFAVIGWNLTIVDPIISVMIGCFILWGAWKLLSECVNVLLEGVPKDLDLMDIRNRLESFPAVDEVHDLHVWTVGHKMSALSAHIIMKEGVDLKLALERIIELLKKDFSIEHVTLQLEPPEFVHQEQEVAHLHA